MHVHCEYSFIAWYGALDVSHSSQSYPGTENAGLILEPVAGFTEKWQPIVVSTAISLCFNFSASSSHIVFQK